MIKEEVDSNHNELHTNNYNVNNQLHYFVIDQLPYQVPFLSPFDFKFQESKNILNR